MGAMSGKLSTREVLDAGLDDWRLLVRSLCTRFATGDFATGLALVNAIGAAAEEMDHHPDLDLRYPHLDVRLSSHDVGGVTDRDVRLARRVSELAAEAGVRARPDAAQALELALDSAGWKAIRPFWKAVLALEDNPDLPDELTDPSGRLPTLWFQDTDPHDEPRQRFHLDVWVPHDQAEARVAAALEAGGTLVRDTEAPSFWVLADAEGNKACVCTCLEREG